MRIDSTVALCLGQFIRQELKLSPESDTRVERSHAPEPSVQMNSGYPSMALERVILRLLDTFCDPATSAHAQRLVFLAVAIGQYLSLSTHEISLLRQAALLHDIGKIAIPPMILHKPGPLNAAETAIMRHHPTIGQQLLLHCGSPFACLAPIVVAHHECWDGSGYPAGLVGTDIPLLARVLAVADAYDAMTSYRPYGQTLSHEDACQELQRCAGRQHDPSIVATFLNMFDEHALPVFSIPVHPIGMVS